MPVANHKITTTVLIASTIVFAINTFNIISVFYLIAEELHQDISSLGLISATLTIGIGLFQIPGGLFAARYSPKMASAAGMGIIATASILVALSTDIYQIAIFRFILGGGLAFFFPAAIVLIAQYFRKGSEAFGVGTITGSNAAGGIIGLVGWALIAGIIGWRASILLGAILAGISAIAIITILSSRKDTKATATQGKLLPQSSAIKLKDVISLLTDKSIVLLGLLLLGSQVVLEQTLAFMPFYLQSALHIDPAFAGLIGSFTLVSALVGSPVTGWYYDRKRVSFLKIVLILGALLLFGAAVNSNHSISTAILSTLFVGFAGGGLFALLSNAARAKIHSARDTHPVSLTTMSVNWVHAIALTGTFWAPLLFAYSTTNLSYTGTWPLIGIISFVMIAAFALIGGRLRLFAVSETSYQSNSEATDNR